MIQGHGHFNQLAFAFFAKYILASSKKRLVFTRCRPLSARERKFCLRPPRSPISFRDHGDPPSGARCADCGPGIVPGPLAVGQSHRSDKRPGTSRDTLCVCVSLESPLFHQLLQTPCPGWTREHQCQIGFGRRSVRINAGQKSS